MKIAFVDPLKSFGGQERFCINLAKAITAKGADVYFLTNEDSVLLEEIRYLFKRERLFTIKFESQLRISTYAAIKEILTDNMIQIAFFNGDRASFYGKFISLRQNIFFL